MDSVKINVNKQLKENINNIFNLDDNQTNRTINWTRLQYE